MIRHVSLLTFSSDTTPAQLETIAVALRALPAQIPELRDYRVGPDVAVDDGNASFAVVGDFDDETGYRTYRDHPAHVAVAREHIVPNLVGRTAVQYTI
jgi:Stress responsive A/B Barrel Domain